MIIYYDLIYPPRGVRYFNVRSRRFEADAPGPPLGSPHGFAAGLAVPLTCRAGRSVRRIGLTAELLQHFQHFQRRRRRTCEDLGPQKRILRHLEARRSRCFLKLGACVGMVFELIGGY